MSVAAAGEGGLGAALRMPRPASGTERGAPSPAAAGRYWSLNTVRALLGLSVLLYHLSGTIALDKYFGVDAFARVFGFGGARVPFFFVLSGFVMTLFYAKDFGRTDRAAGFLWRRFVRLFPTYWIIMATALAVAWLLPGFAHALPDDPWVLLQALLLLPQPTGVAGATGAPVIIVAWTLHYEIVFYLVLAAWIHSRALGLAVCSALVANALVCQLGGGGFHSRFLAGEAMLYFAVGAGAATLVRRLPPLPHALPLAWVALAAYLAVAVLAHGGEVDIEAMADPNIFYVLLAAVLLVCLVKAEAARPPQRSSALMQALSDSSYALYLLHFPMVSALCKLAVALGLSGVGGALLTFAVALPVCVGGALLFHRLVERRLLALR